MPVEPSTMPAKKPGEVIMTDRACIKCGYNLRGLEIGGECPECGTAIANAKKSVRFADSLVNAPMGYIRLMAVGLGVLAGVILLMVVLLIAGRLNNGSVTSPVVPRHVYWFLLTALTGGWFGATWLMTIPRPQSERILPDDILDNKHIRLSSRITQGLTIGAALLGWFAYVSGLGFIKWIAALLAAGALFGLVPFGIYLSAFADWASETGEGARLRAATWCIAVCGTVLTVCLILLRLPVPFRLLIALVSVLMALITVGGVLMFAFSVVMLAKAAGWAIQNAASTRDREIRMANKKRRQAMRDAARAEAAAAAYAETAPPPPESYRGDPDTIQLEEQGDIPLAGDAQSAPVRSSSEHRVERKRDAVRADAQTRAQGDGASNGNDENDPDDSDVYELAPEDD